MHGYLAVEWVSSLSPWTPFLEDGSFTFSSTIHQTITKWILYVLFSSVHF